MEQAEEARLVPMVLELPLVMPLPIPLQLVERVTPEVVGQAERQEAAPLVPVGLVVRVKIMRTEEEEEVVLMETAPTLVLVASAAIRVVAEAVVS